MTLAIGIMIPMIGIIIITYVFFSVYKTMIKIHSRKLLPTLMGIYGILVATFIYISLRWAKIL